MILGVFCVAELGDEWDSFEGGDDSGSSSVGVNVDVGGSDDVGVGVNVKSLSSGETEYTLEFYIALGVGAFGFLIVAVFVYFFLRSFG